ncbi:MAG: hypothetical protein ACRDPT_16910 [Streptomycetales bacterium]
MSAADRDDSDFNDFNDFNSGRNGHDDGPGPFNEIAIPDDASELDDEIRAYRREIRHRRAVEGLQRLARTRRWYRHALSGPVVVLALLGVALIGSLVALLTPDEPQRPIRQPLATASAAVPNQEGGLLPREEVLVEGAPRSPRDLRPGVVALVPPGCRCAGAVEGMFRQAQEYLLDLYLAGGPDQEGQLRELAARTGTGTSSVVVDARGTLTDAYQPRGLTVVLVHSDGVVEAVQRDVRAGTRLELQLAELSAPGAYGGSG